MSRFSWKDRSRCFWVIVSTMKGRPELSVDQVIDQVLHKADELGYYYCWNPEAIPANELSRLREDALIAKGVYGVISKENRDRPPLPSQKQLVLQM